MRLLSVALALAAAAPAAAADVTMGDPAAALKPVALAAAIAEFKTLCADTLGEPAAFAAARSASAWKYTLNREAPAMMRQPGSSWDSDSGVLFHASADWMPKMLPSPQCRLTVALERQDAGDPAAAIANVIAAVAAGLGLGKASIEGKPPQQRATWLVGAKGETRSQFSATIELMGDEPADLSLNLSRVRN